jgi:hypothetical protein
MAAAVAVAAVAAVSCGGRQVAPESPSAAGHNAAPAACVVAKDPLNPMIVEWPAMNRADLDSASRRGVVIVSYAGCVMKVLSNCTAEGSYELTAATPESDTLAIDDESTLVAELPLGLASLKSELQQGKKLVLRYVAVGQRVASKPPGALAGECRGATHWVRTMTVGAHELYTMAAGKVAAGAAVAGVGATGSDSTARTRRGGSGDVDACKSAPKGDGCGAILKLGLMQLSPGGSASAGFGAGLGPAAGGVPVVQPLPELSGLSGALGDADVKLLDLLQAAKRADKDASLGAEKKAEVWGALAAYEGKNPAKAAAEDRQAAWLKVARADAQRRDQAAKVCAEHAKDRSKLDKLLAMDDDVVPPAQKQAYRAEYEGAYAPWANVVASGCGALSGGATDWCPASEVRECRGRGYRSCQVFGREEPSRAALDAIVAAGCGGGKFADCVGDRFGHCCCR